MATNPAASANGLPDLAIYQHLEHAALRGLSPSTLYKRLRLLAAVRKITGAAQLTEVTAAQLTAWRAGLEVDEHSVRTYVSHVRQFFAWAQDQGLRPDNPAARLPVPRRARLLPRPIGEQHLLTAVTEAPPRIKPWLVLAAWAGLRAKEIALLRRENVIEYGSPPGLFVATRATKGRNERFIPLAPYPLQVLLEHGLPSSGWVFPRGDGRPGPNRPDLVSHLASRYLHDLGLPETLHQLRHRFGTQAYAAKGDLRLVQELMGHASPETTAGYVQVAAGSAAEMVALIPAPGQLRAMTGSA